MASTQAIGPVITAVLAILRASAPLAVYVSTRIYPDASGCDVPNKASYPYVSVESGGETPENTMGGTVDVLKFGSHVQLNIRIATLGLSDTQGWNIFGLVKGLLDGQPLTVSGYASAEIEFRNSHPLQDEISGVIVREQVNVFDVLVHQ